MLAISGAGRRQIDRKQNEFQSLQEVAEHKYECKERLFPVLSQRDRMAHKDSSIVQQHALLSKYLVH
jgi:hypothetical protein